MSAVYNGFIEIKIDADGACSYSAAALQIALRIMHNQRPSKGLRDFLDALNLYYGTSLTYDQLRTFLSEKLTTRYDIQQFLAPVMYILYQKKGVVAELDIFDLPESISNAGDYEQMQSTMRQLGLCNTELVLNTGKPPEPIPQGTEFIIHYILPKKKGGIGHYNLFVSAAQYPQEAHGLWYGNSGRYGQNSRYQEGYFCSNGIKTYATEKYKARERVAKLVTQAAQRPAQPTLLTAGHSNAAAAAASTAAPIPAATLTQAPTPPHSRSQAPAPILHPEAPFDLEEPMAAASAARADYTPPTVSTRRRRHTEVTTPVSNAPKAWPAQYATPDVREVNDRVNRLLDQVFATRIDDRKAGQITSVLNEISEASTHHARLATITEVEHYMHQYGALPAPHIASAFQRCHAQARDRGQEFDSHLFPEA